LERREAKIEIRQKFTDDYNIYKDELEAEFNTKKEKIKTE